ncbi:hypothetical protein AB0758_33140 [Tolypothrix bouteillei VB521301_2]|uniref:Uncharacterized protein n=1 Tax=Tolypothrix bouteillei VB521301 TaxID=1479485 RepID=A0A8S9SXS0_9CYAN|nr:hypothetical protein [Tolypothrix bouteillei]KAF3884063.1 hypothetical protein DA73_0400000020 [Tolypothrix bouteillei VB521301]
MAELRKRGDVITTKTTEKYLDEFPRLTVVSNVDGYVKAEHYGWGGTHGLQENLEKGGRFKVEATPDQKTLDYYQD